MRNAFLHGLIFGSGFTIAAIALAAISIFLIPWDRGIASQTTQIMEESTKSFMSAEGVKVLAHEKVIRGDEVVILGTLKNEGQATARSFSIEAELFDKDNKFVELCRDSFFGSSVEPGEGRNFKVSCGGCRNRPVPEHASYKVRITSGL